MMFNLAYSIAFFFTNLSNRNLLNKTLKLTILTSMNIRHVLMQRKGWSLFFVHKNSGHNKHVILIMSYYKYSVFCPFLIF